MEGSIDPLLKTKAKCLVFMKIIVSVAVVFFSLLCLGGKWATFKYNDIDYDFYAKKSCVHESLTNCTDFVLEADFDRMAGAKFILIVIIALWVARIMACILYIHRTLKTLDDSYDNMERVNRYGILANVYVRRAVYGGTIFIIITEILFIAILSIFGHLKSKSEAQEFNWGFGPIMILILFFLLIAYGVATTVYMKLIQAFRYSRQTHGLMLGIDDTAGEWDFESDVYGKKPQSNSDSITIQPTTVLGSRSATDELDHH